MKCSEDSTTYPRCSPCVGLRFFLTAASPLERTDSVDQETLQQLIKRLRRGQGATPERLETETPELLALLVASDGAAAVEKLRDLVDGLPTLHREVLKVSLGLANSEGYSLVERRTKFLKRKRPLATSESDFFRKERAATQALVIQLGATLIPELPVEAVDTPRDFTFILPESQHVFFGGTVDTIKDRYLFRICNADLEHLFSVWLPLDLGGLMSIARSESTIVFLSPQGNVSAAIAVGRGPLAIQILSDDPSTGEPFVLHDPVDVEVLDEWLRFGGIGRTALIRLAGPLDGPVSLMPAKLLVPEQG